MAKKSKKQSNLNFYLKVCAIVGIISVLIPILRIIYMQINEIEVYEEKLIEANCSQMEEIKSLRYWSVCLTEWHDAGSLRTMNRVFERLNYKFVNRSHGDDWDIFWSIEHPLGFYDDDTNLTLFGDFRTKPPEQHQKIHHFPGIGILITKVTMNDNNRGSKYILPFFELPYDEELLQEYLIDNPNKLLLEKNFYNRGVRIVDVKDIVSSADSEFFYQEFMSDHFLIDGHAFDFGIFVLITSFDPVRIYRYGDDILLRFCPKKYHPFDKDDRDKYVVQEGCLSPYEMPSFRRMYKNYGYSIKSIFEKIIKARGFDVADFWKRIDDAIVSIILKSEEFVMEKIVNKNTSVHHFFEIVRFDFVLDNDLQPYVLEVNMSPNLTPANERFENNGIMYEQLVYNTINMIGGGSYYEFWSRSESFQ